jgi:hypothetical protein
LKSAGGIDSHGVVRAVDMTKLTPAECRETKERLRTGLPPVEQLEVEPKNAILEVQQDFVTSIQSNTAPRVGGKQARHALADRVLSAIAASTAHREHVTPTTLPLPTLPLSDQRTRRKAG